MHLLNSPRAPATVVTSINFPEDGELVPYVTVRQAALKPSKLAALSFDRTVASIDNVLDCEERSDTVRLELLALLERVIGLIPRSGVTGELIGLRRDIYNKRRPTKSLSTAAMHSLDQSITGIELRKLCRWLEDCRRVQRVLESGLQQLTLEMDEKRARLRRLAQNPQFRKGVCLASLDFSDELERYIRTESLDVLRRVRRTEASLLRYYARSALKISPFSSLMKAIIIHLSPEDSSTLPFGPAGRRCVHRSVRANRCLIRQLADSLVESAEFADKAPVFYTNGLDRNGQSMCVLQRFYLNVRPARFHVPREITRRIPLPVADKAIKQHLERHGFVTERYKLEAVLASLSNDEEKARAYVDRLLALGILVRAIPFADCASNGIDELERFVKDFSSPTAVAVHSLMADLREAEQSFPRAEPHERLHTLRELDNKIRFTFALLGDRVNTSWGGHILLEDCIESPLRVAPFPHSWQAALSDLQDFFRDYGAILDGNISTRETARYVLSRCGEVRPGFLDFVKCYKNAIDAFAGDQTLVINHTPNPCRLESLDRLADLRVRLGGLISQSSSLREIDLREMADEYRWKSRVEDLKLPAPSSGLTFMSSYCQPCHELGRESTLLITAVSPPLCGLLRVSSALPSADDRARIVAQLHDVLSRLHPEVDVCEVAALFDFNGNLHPQLTPRRIAYDDGEARRGDDIPLDEIALELQPDGSLTLIHRGSGKAILAWDTGTMANSSRPFGQHLLLSLGNVDFIFRKNFFHPGLWSHNWDGDEGIQHFSRLRYGRCILRRQGWNIPYNALPRRVRGVDDFQYFLDVRRWQRHHRIPTEVFVSVGLRTSTSKGMSFGSLNKPQYVHFANFFLVDVLGKIINEVEDDLYVEEVLPASTSWQECGLYRPTEYNVDVCVRYR